MFTAFDPALLTHRAARHVPADDQTREANRLRRAARRAAWSAFLAKVMRKATTCDTALRPVKSRA